MKTKDAIIGEMLTNEYAMFYRIAFSYVHNEADAQDIVQESAYKAIFYAHKLKKPEYAKTWLCRIVINEAISFLRKKGKEQMVWKEQERAVVETVETAERTDLHNALDRLTEEEKTIIVLRFFEDMKLEEIAAICEENVNTIKSRLYRTLKKLKLDLEV